MTATAAELRAQAAEIRQASQYTGDYGAYQYEMKRAADLEAAASRLEPPVEKPVYRQAISDAEREAIRRQKIENAKQQMEEYFSPEAAAEREKLRQQALTNPDA